MGTTIHPETGAMVHTGAERATLVRRTYTLVFFSILTTIVGATYGMSSPSMMEAINRNWFLSALCVFVPLIGANYLRDRFPLNIALVFLFTLAMGVLISPQLYFF